MINLIKVSGFELSHFVFGVFCLSLLQLFFVVFPFLWRRNYLKTLLVVFCVLYFDNSILNLPRKITFFPLYYNWLGKLLQFLWPLVVVYIFKWMTSKEVGFCLPKKSSDWILAGILGLGIPTFFFLIDLLFGGESNPTPFFLKSILFQFSMPGLAEELVYRGIILAIFNRYFDKPWKIFNVSIGWGLICTTLLFTAVHVVIFFPRTGEIRWDFTPFIPVFFTGFILGWLREKTKSVWPSVLMHNFVNGFSVLGKF
jgi:hypothetical protein